MEYVRPGDTLVVAEFSRMTRSLLNLLETTGVLEQRQINLVSLRENIDTSTATGRCFLSMMGAIHQMERELRAERAASGRASAKARGKTGGRPRTDITKLETPDPLWKLRQDGCPGVLDRGCWTAKFLRPHGSEAQGPRRRSGFFTFSRGWAKIAKKRLASSARPTPRSSRRTRPKTSAYGYTAARNARSQFERLDALYRQRNAPAVEPERELAEEGASARRRPGGRCAEPGEEGLRARGRHRARAAKEVEGDAQMTASDGTLPGWLP